MSSKQAPIYGTVEIVRAALPCVAAIGPVVLAVGDGGGTVVVVAAVVADVVVAFVVATVSPLSPLRRRRCRHRCPGEFSMLRRRRRCLPLSSCSFSCIFSPCSATPSTSTFAPSPGPDFSTASPGPWSLVRQASSPQVVCRICLLLCCMPKRTCASVSCDQLTGVHVSGSPCAALPAP